MTYHSLSRYQNLIDPDVRSPPAAIARPSVPAQKPRDIGIQFGACGPIARGAQRPARSRICAARTRSTSGDRSRGGAVWRAAVVDRTDRRHADRQRYQERPGDGGTQSSKGGGIRHHLRRGRLAGGEAAASGSPPGSAAPTTRAEAAGARDPDPDSGQSPARLPGRCQARALDGVGGAESADERARSAALPGANAGMPVNISYSTRPSE